MYIHQGYWPVFSFFCSTFVWFWCQGNDDFVERIWEYSVLFSFLEQIKKDRYKLFYVSENFSVTPSDPGFLFAGNFLKIVLVQIQCHFQGSVYSNYISFLILSFFLSQSWKIVGFCFTICVAKASTRLQVSRNLSIYSRWSNMLVYLFIVFFYGFLYVCVIGCNFSSFLILFGSSLFFHDVPS